MFNYSQKKRKIHVYIFVASLKSHYFCDSKEVVVFEKEMFTDGPLNNFVFSWRKRNLFRGSLVLTPDCDLLFYYFIFIDSHECLGGPCSMQA